MAKRHIAFILLPIISFLSNTASAKEDIHVLTSIKPVHSLVSLVMKGVGNPQLIVPGAASPHGFSLKPSQAKLMEKADIIFWIGPNLETFLEKPLQVISNKATKIKLIETPKLEKLMFRAGGKFEEHVKQIAKTREIYSVTSRNKSVSATFDHCG